jgi:hypothetical protein
MSHRWGWIEPHLLRAALLARFNVNTTVDKRFSRAPSPRCSLWLDHMANDRSGIEGVEVRWVTFTLML